MNLVPVPTSYHVLNVMHVTTMGKTVKATVNYRCMHPGLSGSDYRTSVNRQYLKARNDVNL